MNRKKAQQTNKGFTMIELIVVFAILTGLSILLTKIFISHGDIFHLSTANAELQIGAGRMMGAIGEYARHATQVVDAKTINAVSYVTDESTVILELPSIDADADVIPDTYDYAVFYVDPVDGSRLKFALDPDPLSERSALQKELTDLIRTIRFSYNAADLAMADAVSVDATLTRHIPGGEETYGVSGRFNLQNR